MKASIISFSQKGQILAEFLANQIMRKESWVVSSFTTNAKRENSLTKCIDETLTDWASSQFEQSELIIFVGACGIAVRSIAHVVSDKQKDPAVIVIDELGHHVISLLSGHLGGGNAWTKCLADWIEADPVITTASDLNEKIAIDLFAKKNHCMITDRIMAKEVEAAILSEERIGLFCEGEIRGKIAEEFILNKACNRNISIGIQRPDERLHALWLIPKVVSLGIGCRKNIPKEAILRCVSEALNKYHIPIESIKDVKSIELKKDEEGLKSFCLEKNIPFHCFSVDQLENVTGSCSQSKFVKQITGVDNVCERAALCGLKNGKLLFPKYAVGGVTVSAAIEEWRISFE